MTRLQLLGALFAMTLATAARADDWPQFRGPGRDGRSGETGLMQSWPAGGPAMLATIAGIGRGYSSPIIVKGRIYLTGVADEQEQAFCFDLAGKKLWQTPLSPGLKLRPGLCTRSTPAVDGERLYVRALDGAAVALNINDGSQAWRIDVVKDFKGTLPPDRPWRMARDNAKIWFGGDEQPGLGDELVYESPLVDGNNIICTAGGPDACLVALDKKTGATVWTSKGVSDRPWYASPIAFDFGGVHQICTVTTTGTIGVRASDGKLLWRWDKAGEVAGPIFIDGLVFVGQGSACRLNGEGENIKADTAFTLPANRGWAGGGYPASNLWWQGVVPADGFVFGGSGDFDRARCAVNLKTGKVSYYQLENTMCGRVVGPILWADGRLYYQSEYGSVRLYTATPEKPQQVGLLYFPYLNGKTTAHPAISEKKLFVRNQERVFVYDIDAQQAPATAPVGAASADQPPASRSAKAAPTSQPTTTDWPQFRGPHRDGKSSEIGLLKKWPKDGPPLLWTIDAGKGSGSPSIVGERIYIAGEFKNKSYMLCLDTAGKEIWRTPIGNAGSRDYGPCSTPTVDGDLLYYLFDNGTLYCMETATGAVRWQVDLPKTFRGRASGWGYTESVLVEDGKVYCCPGGPDACMVALDKATGKTIWTSKGLSDGPACGSIISFDYKGTRLLVTDTRRSMVCVRAADGKFLWRWDRPCLADPDTGFGEATGDHSVTTPFHVDGLIGAFNIHTCGGLVRLMGEGDNITAQQVWDSYAIWPKASGYIELDGTIYGCGLPGNGAAWTAVDLRTGRTLFYTATNGLGGPIIYADGMFYVLAFRSSGSISLVEATPKGLNRTGMIPFPESISYPAISNGRFYVRAGGKLSVFDVRDKGIALATALCQRYGQTDAAAVQQRLLSPDAATVALLLGALKDKDDAVRRGATDALAMIDRNNADAASALLAGLKDDATRLPAAEALVRLQPVNEQLVPIFESRLNDPAARASALEMLARMSSDNEAARAAIGKALADDQMHLAAADALVKFDPQHPKLLPAIVAALETKDEARRVTALGLIERLATRARDEAAKLEPSLADASPAIRLAAVKALLAVAPRDKQTVVTLSRVFAADKDETVRKFITDSLNRMGKQPFLQLTYVRGSANGIWISANMALDAVTATKADNWRLEGADARVTSAEIVGKGDTRIVQLKTDAALPLGKMLTLHCENVRSADGVAPPTAITFVAVPGVPLIGDGLHECLVGEVRAGVNPADAIKKGLLDASTGPTPGEKWQVRNNAWGSFDLLPVVGQVKDAAVHAHFYVWSDAARTVQLWAGSHDGIRIVVNGNAVHANAIQRTLVADEDRVPNVAMRAGWNSVLVTITRSGDKCGFALKIVGEDGKTPPGGMGYCAQKPD